MAGLHFDITADNSNLTKKLQETERQVKNMSDVVEHEGENIENLFSRLRKAVAVFGTGFTAKELVNQVIKVRGEFQQLEVAFTTMLGSQEKATALMSQLTETAAKTPFDLQGVANGARQLLAYGTSAENVNETLIRLGNIAAGLSIPLNDLVYLYGTTMTQGRLYTQDLNQFTGRGIPMIRELAKEFGVAESEIKAMVEAGQIGFPEVQKVINNLTNEGGMFFNLMQEQSKTITGQISNIGDSFSMMLNNIGQANEGIINDALSGVSYLIENYEKVGKILLELVGTYGTYRTALMAITALHNLQAAGIIALTAKEAIHYSWLVLTQKAQSALNKTLLANPYVASAAAVAALGLGIYKLATYQTESEKAQERLNEAAAESEKSALSEQRGLARLKGELSALKEGTNEYNAVKEKIISSYSKYYDGLEEEINQVGLTEQAYDKLTKAITRSFGARQYQQFKSQQEDWLNDIMSDNLGKLQKRLYSELGDEQGAKVYSQIYRAILEQRELDNNLQKTLDEIQDKGTLWADARIDGYINNIREAQRVTEEVDKKARERFGVMNTGTISQHDKSPFSAEGKSISQIEEEIKKAQAALEGLKKSLVDGSVTQEAVTQQEAYIKSLQDTVLEREKDLKVISQVEAQISKLKKEQQETVYGSKEYNLLELRRRNQKAETDLMEEGTQKKLKRINDDYEAQKAAIEKKAKELAELNKKTGASGTDDIGLTSEQRAAIDEAIRFNEKYRKKEVREVYEAEAEAMRSYLKEYGTFQQQKLAIAEEYAAKIRNAETEGERLSLQAESNRAIQQVEINAIKQQIDWGSVFSDFGTIFKDQLQPTIDKLREIAESDTFKQSSLEEQSALYELIDKLENANAAWDSDIFRRVSDDIIAYQSAMRNYTKSVEKARIAEEKLTKAKSTLDDAKKEGLDEQAISAAQANVNTARAEFNAASEDVKKFGSQVQESTTSLNSSSAEAKAMFDNLSDGLKGLSSGSLEGIGNGVMKLDKLFGGELTKNAGNAIAKGFQSLLGKDSQAAKTLSEELGKSGLAGQIISAILGVLDMLAEGGVGGIVSNLIDTVLGAANGILDNIFSGDIIIKPVKSLVDGIGGILDTITFGGFSSWINSSNAKDVKETIDRLTERNEALQSSIDSLNETIKEARGTQSVKAAEQAEEYQKKINQNYLEIAMAQAGYHGSHHSWNYYWDGFSKEQIDKMSEQIGREWNGSLWNLSPEEMKILRSNVDMWTQIQNTGKGGYGDRLTERLDDYIEQAGKLDEITNTLRESLTQISFDSMYDSFIDRLMDMNARAEDFADDFSEYMMKAMLANKVGELMYVR